jgi:hypothetical protein
MFLDFGTYTLLFDRYGSSAHGHNGETVKVFSLRYHSSLVIMVKESFRRLGVLCPGNKRGYNPPAWLADDEAGDVKNVLCNIKRRNGKIQF